MSLFTKAKFILARNLTKWIAWEAVQRIRCGKSVRVTTYHEHFKLRSSDLLALPIVDCDKTLAMRIPSEDTSLTTQTVYLRAVLLSTSSLGKGGIRVADLDETYHDTALKMNFNAYRTDHLMISEAVHMRTVVKRTLAKNGNDWMDCLLTLEPAHAKEIEDKMWALLVTYWNSLCIQNGTIHSAPFGIKSKTILASYTLINKTVRAALKFWTDSLLFAVLYLFKRTVASHKILVLVEDRIRREFIHVRWYAKASPMMMKTEIRTETVAKGGIHKYKLADFMNKIIKVVLHFAISWEIDRRPSLYGSGRIEHLSLTADHEISYMMCPISDLKCA